MIKLIQHHIQLLVNRKGGAAMLAVFVLLGACGLGADRPAARMQLSVADGTATVIHKGDRIVVRRDQALSAGDTVTVPKGSLAEIRLGSGRDFELADGNVRVVSTSALSLSRGKLLADLTRPARVDASSVQVTSSKGAFRVDRALASRVGVYSGTASLRIDGESLPVPRYRQAVVAGGVLPRSARPLILDPKDRWDQRIMQSALELDRRLALFARGLEAQLGPGGGLTFFQRVMDAGIDLGFLTTYTGDRRADVLIALAFTGEADEPADLSQRFEQIFELWREGASWGLIALEFNVAQEGVFARLLEAIQKAGIAIVGGRGPGLGLIGGGRTPSPSPQPTRSGSPGPTPTSTSSPTVGPTSPGPSPVVPGPVRSVAPGVSDVLEELYGSLTSPSP